MHHTTTRGVPIRNSTKPSRWRWSCSRSDRRIDRDQPTDRGARRHVSLLETARCGTTRSLRWPGARRSRRRVERAAHRSPAYLRLMLRDPWLRALAILGCAIAAFYLATLLWQVAQQVADILLLFFLAWLLAFVLEPVVGTLVQTHLPRLPAIGLAYLALLVLPSLAVILFV